MGEDARQARWGDLMRIASLYVDHFRCLKDVRLYLDPLTVLVGKNGTGKSAFLRALEIRCECFVFRRGLL